MAENVYVFKNSSIKVDGIIANSSSLRSSSKFFATDGTIQEGGGSFVTLNTTQTITGNKTFESDVEIDSLTTGDLVVNGQSTFTNTLSADNIEASNVSINTLNATAVAGNTNFTGEITVNAETVGNLTVTGSAIFTNDIDANITGNAATVNGHTVNKDVPADAKFTDENLKNVLSQDQAYIVGSVAANATTTAVTNANVWMQSGAVRAEKYNVQDKAVIEYDSASAAIKFRFI